MTSPGTDLPVGTERKELREEARGELREEENADAEGTTGNDYRPESYSYTFIVFLASCQQVIQKKCLYFFYPCPNLNKPRNYNDL
jgi:hypothetical protein